MGGFGVLTEVFYIQRESLLRQGIYDVCKNWDSLWVAKGSRCKYESTCFSLSQGEAKSSSISKV